MTESHVNKPGYFSSLAGEWEALHSRKRESDALRRLAGAFRLDKGDRVLDAGCGTGRLCPFLRERVGPRGRIIELDFAADMLRICRGKIKHRRTGFVQADSENLPFPESVFDAVICFSLFPHLDRPRDAAREFFRVLVPGRKAFIAHLMSREELNLMHRRASGPVRHDRLPGAPEMRDILGAAGFEGVQIVDRPGWYFAEAKRPAL